MILNKIEDRSVEIFECANMINIRDKYKRQTFLIEISDNLTKFFSVSDPEKDLIALWHFLKQRLSLKKKKIFSWLVNG